MNRHAFANKMWVMAVLIVIALMFVGCVTQDEVRRAEQRLAEVQAEIKVIEQGPKIEDPHSAWMCGPRPANRVFNLPGGESIEMIGIPCGSFVMGAPVPEIVWHGDVVGHKVTLTEPFWIGKFPVTVAQRRILLPDPEGIRIFIAAFKDEIKPDKFEADWHEDMLTWEDAQNIVEEMNRLFGESLPEGYHFALPTEAQWEYACRAGTVETYNNGKNATIVKKMVKTASGKNKVVNMFADKCPNLDEVGWYSANCDTKRHNVGMKKPNAWGIYDMHGLGDEWCQDFYSDALERTSVNMINPKGPSSGDAHVKRGAGYGFPPPYHTSYHRKKGGVYPHNPKLNHVLWGKPVVGSMRLAIVKDAPEAVDVSDSKLYGKNYITVNDWQKGKIAAMDRKNKEVFEPIQKKAALLPLMKFTAMMLEVAQPAVEVYVNDRIERAFRDKSAKRKAHANGGEGTSNESAPTGFGTIKGPSSLSSGQTATYTLYVGGKKMTSGVDWSQDGTSISVYGAGDYARAMAGNPPVKSGFFRSGIKATVNGKTYRKTIRIH